MARLSSRLPYDRRVGRKPAPSPVFRKSFEIDRPIRSATVNVCGLGFYELHLNGGKVGDHVLDPSFTRYDKRALYATYDVTDRVKQGHNAIGAMLGNGWYNPAARDAWNFDKSPWRDRPWLILRLRIVLNDGSVQTVASDGSWRATIGPVVRDGIRNGESLRCPPRYGRLGYAGLRRRLLGGRRSRRGPQGRVAGGNAAAGRVQETVTPVAVTEPKPGVFVVDMGRNIAGWTQLKVTGPAGTRDRHAIRRTPQSRRVCSITPRSAMHVYSGSFQTDTYILKGQGEEVWEPRFIYNGFRYVEVAGFPGKATVENFRGRVVHTSFEDAGRSSAPTNC